MTKERQGKGWRKKNNETNKHIQPGTVKVYSSLKYHPDNLVKRKTKAKKHQSASMSADDTLNKMIYLQN